MFFLLLLFWAEIPYKLEKHTGDRMATAAAPSSVDVVNLPPKARAGAEKAGLAGPADPAL